MHLTILSLQAYYSLSRKMVATHTATLSRRHVADLVNTQQELSG
nr:MAG TPA: hypothetical protein [Caudoviricetes sp.]